MLKLRIFKILEPAEKGDVLSYSFDMTLIVLIIINTLVVIFEGPDLPFGFHNWLVTVSNVSIAIFTIEYILRLWTADLKYPYIPLWKARKQFVLSFYGMVDLLVLLAFFLPYLFIVDLRVLRTARILQLFRAIKITRYTEAPVQVARVLKKKAGYLISTMTIAVLLIMITAVLIYSVEGKTRNEQFDSIFSAFYWSVMTIATVGYGDISPSTTIGRILSSFVVLLGMGLVALPAGIISAGFIEEVDRTAGEEGYEHIKHCPYCGKDISMHYRPRKTYYERKFIAHEHGRKEHKLHSGHKREHGKRTPHN